LRPIDILTGEIAIEVTGVVGVSPALWYFRYIASIFLTTQAPVYTLAPIKLKRIVLYLKMWYPPVRAKMCLYVHCENSILYTFLHSKQKKT
jgi:hypothetical protein